MNEILNLFNKDWVNSLNFGYLCDFNDDLSLDYPNTEVLNSMADGVLDDN